MGTKAKSICHSYFIHEASRCRQEFRFCGPTAIRFSHQHLSLCLIKHFSLVFSLKGPGAFCSLKVSRKVRMKLQKKLQQKRFKWQSQWIRSAGNLIKYVYGRTQNLRARKLNSNAGSHNNVYHKIYSPGILIVACISVFLYFCNLEFWC